MEHAAGSDLGACQSSYGIPSACPARGIISAESVSVMVLPPKGLSRCKQDKSGYYTCVSKEEIIAKQDNWPYSPSDWQMFYTLDGSEPTERSPKWEAEKAYSFSPETGKSAVTLRIIAIAPDGEKSRIATATYVFPKKLLSLGGDPAGLPRKWLDERRERVLASYDVDERFLKEQNIDLVSVFTEIPSVSIVASEVDLFSEDCGIYINPEGAGNVDAGIDPSNTCRRYRNRSSDDLWKRLASVELIEPQADVAVMATESKQNGFGVDAAIKIQGGSSAEGWKSRKLSMQLNFRSKYGEKNLKYPIFAGDNDAVSHFRTLVLDAHLNNSFVHPDDEQALKPTYWSDALVSDVFLELGHKAPHSRFVHLFLAGIYWGLYDLHEKPDEYFAADYFGGEESDYDVIKHGESLVSGRNLDSWQLIWDSNDDLHDNDALRGLAGVVDLDALTDYLLINIWAANTDWPHHNYYGIYDNKNKSRGWHFISWDAERSFASYKENIVSYLDGDHEQLHSPGDLFKDLMTNKGYRKDLSRRFEQLTSEGVLSPDRITRIYERRISEINGAIIFEAARWGREYGRNSAQVLRAWHEHKNYITDTFFSRRPKEVKKHIDKW